MTSATSNDTANHRMSDEFLAGAISGGMSIIVGHPLDTLKTLTQNSGANASVYKLTKEVYRVGFSQFFRGLSVPLLSYTVINSIFFGSYKHILHILEPSQQPSSIQMAIAGSMAGAIQLTVCVPVEVIKIQMQKDAGLSGASSSLRQGIKSIYKSNGLRGFYRGLLPHAARDMPAGAVYFSTYTMMNEYFCYQKHFSPVVSSFWSGALSGCLSWIAAMPQDVIKTRMQAGTDKTLLESVRSLRKIGLSAFFNGTGLVLTRAFLVNAIVFTMFDLTIQLLRRRRLEKMSSDDS